MKKTAPQRRFTRPAIIFTAIMIVAVVIRVVWLWQLTASEIGNVPSIDSKFYRDLATTILSGQSLPQGALTFNPLYPFFLVVVFKLFGQEFLATRIVQSFLGLVAIALIYIAGKRLVEGPRKGKLSGNVVSLVAMSMAVLYPQFLAYEGMLLGTTIEMFLLAASFTLALAMDEDLQGVQALRVGPRRVPPWLGGSVLGGMCGAGALGRPNLFLLLVAGIPLWMLARNREKRVWLAPVLGFVVGAALFLVPPTVYNAKNTGKFIPVTAHGGINFYIGNQPGTIGVYQVPKDMRGDMRGLIEDARYKAEQETGRKMTDAEASDYFMQKALANIKLDPAGWLLLLGRKLVLFWNKIEVHDMPEVLYFEDSMLLFRFLFLPFSVIAPLGLAGLVIFLRSGRNRSVVCLFLGAAHAAVVFFYINSRYRLPVVPVVILLAAFFIAWAAREISRRRVKYAALMAAAALLTFFLVSNRTIVKANKSSVYTFLGNYYMNSGNMEKGAEAFAEAYRLDPHDDVSMINYARILRMQNEDQKAADLYARAFALHPRYPRLATEYAYTLESLGQHVEALKVLALAAYYEGRKNEAMKLVKAALEIAPTDAQLIRMLQMVESMQ